MGIRVNGVAPGPIEGTAGKDGSCVTVRSHSLIVYRCPEKNIGCRETMQGCIGWEVLAARMDVTP